jgi:hypothetical protein
MRDFITTASLGIVTKLYDDLTDNSIIGDGIVKESLFTILCFLLSAVSYNDFTFSIIMYLMNITAFMGGPEQYENLKEKSLIYGFPILILLSISSIASISFFEVLILFGAILIIFAESIIIKEDVSIRKLIIRSILAISIGALIGIGSFFFSISKSTIKFLFFSVAYLSSSVLFQIYSLFIKNDELYQKWSVPVNSKVVTDQPEKIETSSENTKQEKVSDSQQKQV